MKSGVVLKILNALAAISMMTVTTAVNSACCLIVYEEKMPEAATELIRK